MTAHALDTHQHAAFCKNCDAAIAGNYCHQCGQATHLHVPSAREFLHEFIAHYVRAGQPGALPGRTLDDAGTPVDMDCVERVRMDATSLGMNEAAIRLRVATDCE